MIKPMIKPGQIFTRLVKNHDASLFETQLKLVLEEIQQDSEKSNMVPQLNTGFNVCETDKGPLYVYVFWWTFLPVPGQGKLHIPR